MYGCGKISNKRNFNGCDEFLKLAVFTKYPLCNYEFVNV